MEHLEGSEEGEGENEWEGLDKSQKNQKFYVLKV
jgi:hypothetical protein